MTLNAKRALWRWIMFGILGLFFEMCVMSMGVAREGNWSLRGASSPWMLPIYGLIGLILEPVGAPLRRRGIPLPLRAVIYVMIFYVVEFSSGSLYLALGINKHGVDNMHTVWDYSGMAYNINGQVTFSLLPFWYAFCFILEFLYRPVDMAATAIALRFKPEDQIAARRA